MGKNEKSTISDNYCAFGPALKILRQTQNLSQSRLSIVAECNVTNLRKIEKGEIQPGVSLAIRLVAATGADVGIFFQELAGSAFGLEDKEGLSPNLSEGEESLVARIQLDNATPKSCFGLLFKEIRIHYGITQKAIATKTKYHLRNLLNVESGNQEPGIMTALAMVLVTECNIYDVFNRLSGIIYSKK